MSSTIQVVHGNPFIHNGTNSGYLPISLPEDVQNGDLLVAIIQTIGAPTQTPEELWSLVGSWTSGNQHVTVFTWRYDSSEGYYSSAFDSTAEFMQGQVFGLRNTATQENPVGPVLTDTSLSQTAVPNLTWQDWPSHEDFPHRKVYFAAAYKDGYVYEADTRVTSSEHIATAVYNQSGTFGAGLGIGAEQFLPFPHNPAPSVSAPWNPDEKLYGTIAFIDGPADPEDPDESDEPDPEEPIEECCSHKEIVIRIKVKDICGVEVTSD